MNFLSGILNVCYLIVCPFDICPVHLPIALFLFP